MSQQFTSFPGASCVVPSIWKLLRLGICVLRDYLVLIQRVSGFASISETYWSSVQVVSQYSSLLAPLAVDAVLNVRDLDRPDSVDLRDIKVLRKLGGTVSP